MLNATQGFTYNKFEKPNDWPKIDKTFDYKIENGKLLSANEHIYLNGPVTYTKVGNPTIKDNIASGFTTSNYLTIAKTESTITSLEIFIKVKTGSTIVDGERIFRQGTSFILKTTGTPRFNFVFTSENTQHTFNFNTDIRTNTDYWIKLTASNGNVSASLSTDGKNYTTSANTYSGAIKPFSSSFGTTLGASADSSELPFNGSIDLTETYVKINDHLWFYGKNYTTKNMVPVPAGLEYNNTTTPSIGWVDTDTSSSNFQQFIPAPQGTMIGKDEAEMLQVETYQNKGTVDYTVVGSLTIVDGVASGFKAGVVSSAAVLTLPSSADLSKHFNIHLSFTPTEKTYGILLGKVGNNTSGVIIQGIYNNTVRIALYNSSNTAFFDTNFVYDTDITPGTKYALALSFDGDETYSLNITEADTNASVLSKTFTTSTAGVSGFTVGANKADIYYVGFKGSVDLNNTYIKVNGQMWFHPYPDSYPKLVGPVGYSIVGSPMITNGIISGINLSNYAITSQVMNQPDYFEEVCEFTMPNSWVGTSTIKTLLVNGNARGLDIYNPSPGVFFLHCYLRFTDNTDGGYWINNFGLQAGQTYTGKLIRNNDTEYVLELWQNGSKIQEKVINETKKMLNNSAIFVGSSSGTSYFEGAINLNNTYIKVNGSLWFGKEDWKPSTYNDNSIYLLSSHKEDYSSYNKLNLNPIVQTESDEAGSYNIWIDNQKVIENKVGNTLLEWDKLALTTGYSITTPSSLKGHLIKIEPTNNTDSIIRFNTEDSNESI